ncbi:hypothetical protein SLS55_007672 [Diplodia seriata]|uniref:Pal1-domain-containing protein n=3 Tax=Diplodia seriata TaxID=420778 RepID=A0ABR3C8A2_9PEZI
MDKFAAFTKLFANYPKPQAEMSLQDKDDRKAGPNGASFPRPPGPSRSGTAPGRPPRPDDDHRRNASGSRAPPRRPPPREELDIFKSPGRGENRRPRRNSESSIMDKTSMEEERRRRERRHRERKERESGRTTRDKDGKVRKPRGLDLIDKLDVSGIYGPSMFHHDGPFDACNPHRNRKRDQRAPMQAFPEGSANNVMGGSGPVNQSMNLDQFHGRGAEGFSDFSSAARPEVEPPKPSAAQTGFYNPKADIEAIHGDESNGLGTSTFLEGAPASRKDLERRDSETDGLGSMGGGGGLARKKSLAQRIRGISQPRRDYGGRVVSPDAQYEFRRPPPPPPNGQSSPMSAGGRGKMQEKNPFFDDYDDAYEKKGASIRISEQQRPGRARAPSSPGRPNLERLPTGEAGPADEPKPSGFLGRMKSLKGGPRKPKPERRAS